MDPNFFDALTRSLVDGRTRRAALGGLLVGTLGLLVTPGADDTMAHDASLKCKKLKGDRFSAPAASSVAPLASVLP